MEFLSDAGIMELNAGHPERRRRRQQRRRHLLPKLRFINGATELSTREKE